MSEELKPCPFCGGEAIHDSDNGEPIIRFKHERGCFLGDGETMYDCPETIAAWNRRAERTCTPIEVLEEGEFGLFIHHDCSECHEQLGLESWPNYCQNCGARVVEE